MNHLIGLSLLCATVVWGQGVTNQEATSQGFTVYPKGERDPTVLRIVSTLISPYLELRGAKGTNEIKDSDRDSGRKTNIFDNEGISEEDLIDVNTGASRRRRNAEGTTLSDTDTRTPEDSTEPTAKASSMLSNLEASSPTVALGIVSNLASATPVIAVESSSAANAPTADDTVESSTANSGPSSTSGIISTETPLKEDNITTILVTSSAPVVTSSGLATSSESDDYTTEFGTDVFTTAEPMTPYQGFIPDLFDLMLPFIPNITKYEIYIVAADDTLTAYDKMIKEVVAGNADVAAGPMTVTIYKEEFVDFTYPFQRLEAKFVIHKTLENKFKTLEDLVYQKSDNDVKPVNYGVKKDSAIYKILKESKKPVHQTMIEHMENNVVALKDTNEKGVNRARFGGYAFILEGSLADWVVGQPPCSLVSVGAGFFKRQYALAVPQQSEWRDKLNKALLEVDDELQHLTDKWLRPGECNSAISQTTVQIAPTILCSVLVLLVARFL